MYALFFAMECMFKFAIIGASVCLLSLCAQEIEVSLVPSGRIPSPPSYGRAEETPREPIKKWYAPIIEAGERTVGWLGKLKGAGFVEATGRIVYWRNVGDGIRYAQAVPGLVVAVGSAPSTPQIVQPIYTYGLSGAIRYVGPRERYFFAIGGVRVSATAKDRSTPPPGGFLIPTFDADLIDTLNSASISWKMKYRHADLDGGVRVAKRSSPVRIFLSGGLRYARIAFEEVVEYDPTDVAIFQVIQRHGFSGLGPRLGAQMRYRPFLDRLAGKLYVDGNLGVSGIVGHQRLTIDGPSGIFFGGLLLVNGLQFYPNDFVVVPAFDFHFSLSYRIPFDTVWVGIEFGYELNYYVNVDKRIASTQASPSMPRDGNVGYGGPYLAIRGGF